MAQMRDLSNLHQMVIVGISLVLFIFLMKNNYGLQSRHVQNEFWCHIKLYQAPGIIGFCNDEKVNNIQFKVKRSRARIMYYGNSTATFRVIIQLRHDIELNPV